MNTKDPCGTAVSLLNSFLDELLLSGGLKAARGCAALVRGFLTLALFHSAAFHNTSPGEGSLP